MLHATSTSWRYVNQWIKLTAIIAVVLLSLEIRLKRYRNMAASDLVSHEQYPKSWMGTKSVYERSYDASNQTITSINKTTRSKRDRDSNNADHNDVDEIQGYKDFDEVLWPRIQNALCPGGVPDQSMGPTLFELGRIEFGLAHNASAANNAESSERNREKTVSFFYDGGFGFTLYLDGSDPNNTLFYAPIWKCANDQIHAYLHHIFNRKPDGKIRDRSVSIGNSNDTYLESLHVNDLEYLLYEQVERPNQKTTSSALGKTDNDKDYFTYNKISRAKPCVFAVLRDPISHFLSGYNEVEYRLITGKGGAPELILENDFNTKLAPYVKIPYDEGPEKREERFRAFVKNLLKEHPSFSYFGYYKHLASMSRILPTLSKLDLLPQSNNIKDSASPSWLLPSLDNLLETFPKFLAERCPRATQNYIQQQQQQSDTNKVEETSAVISPKFPPMKRMGKHESSKDGYGTYQAAKTVWNEHGSVSRALCALHAMDYACFGSSLQLPPLCKDVFASQTFLDTILFTGGSSG